MARLVLLLALTACAGSPPWQSLFDGESLGQWAPTEFGGEGLCKMEDGALVLDFGSPLTGVTWHGDVPAGDYEISLSATRRNGSDFFCALTFPVSGSHLTLVVGGWGGSLVGLSSLDGLDASENRTRTIRSFTNGRPYRIRLRVAGTVVQAWIDNELVVQQDIAGYELSLRPEIDLSKPLGIASFASTAELRDIRLREL